MEVIHTHWKRAVRITRISRWDLIDDDKISFFCFQIERIKDRLDGMDATTIGEHVSRNESMNF